MTPGHEEVYKVLGEPVFGDLPENALKVRRNLLIVSFVSIFFALGDLKVSPDADFFGVKLSGISPGFVLLSLFLFNAYFLIHFLWYSVESFMEWRIRLTGTRLAFITSGTFASELCDYPSDPRQSSLYRWWADNVKRLTHLQGDCDNLSRKLDVWSVPVELGSDSPGCRVLRSDIVELKSAVDKLAGSVNSLDKNLTSERIPASLERFDSWFKYFLHIQNIRWFLVDIVVPVLIGFISIGFLLFFN